MPEIISKYPDVVLKILKGVGAKCGEGKPQKILTKCPPERFCALPTGEICVYGLDEVDQTTQIARQEIIQEPPITPEVAISQPTMLSPPLLIITIFIILIAFAFGFLAGKKTLGSGA